MDIVRKSGLSQEAKGFVRAGPRSHIIWAPGEVKAAIATCGGLCPGLNDVVEELVEVLYYNYGVDDIYGVRMGYRGFHQSQYQPMMKLTPESVEGIHNLGGTVLGSSRGGFDHVKILDACIANGINQLYLIGGDGTHRAADIIYKHARDRGLKMTVVGIPKTIDNDIGTIDKYAMITGPLCRCLISDFFVRSFIAIIIAHLVLIRLSKKHAKPFTQLWLKHHAHHGKQRSAHQPWAAISLPRHYMGFLLMI